MKHVSSDNFGLVIAYLLPGFALLWGLRPYIPAVEQLLGASPGDVPTVGNFLNGTVAALGAGMTLSTVRWVVVDAVHHATGVHPPRWDFSRLKDSAAAFEIVVEHYYKYYLFHANGLIALAVIFAARRWSLGVLTGPFGWMDLGLLGLMAVFFAGSRQTLRRYYARGGALLQRQPQERSHRRGRRSSPPAGSGANESGE